MPEISRILVVDDEKLARWSLKQRLVREGEFAVDEAVSGEQMLQMIASAKYDLVLLDLGLPGISGDEALRCAKREQPRLKVIMLTAVNDADTALVCLRAGALDYICKPVDLESIEAIVHRVLAGRPDDDDEEASGPLAGFIGESAAVREIRQQVRRIIRSKAVTVLIQGESGTGKDVLAKAIHQSSPRAGNPFMAINCTNLPVHLLESELFGYEKGAFTDAKARKKGLFELADHGTLLLDEIGDLDLSLQVKLLRVIEERRFKRLGGIEDVAVDLRIIATTNVDLQQAVADGTFRMDLFYRLNVIPIVIPPLRERRADIPVLIDHFVDILNRELETEIRDVSQGALSLLYHYDWPGNAREVRNVFERISVLEAAPTILVTHLPAEIRDREQRPTEAAPNEDQSLRDLPDNALDLKTHEQRLIVEALRRCDGNLTHAGKLLGLHRDTLRYRAQKYGLLAQEDS